MIRRPHARVCQCPACLPQMPLPFRGGIGERVTGNEFVDDVVEGLRRRGLEAWATLDPCGGALVGARHAYGLPHELRFLLPSELSPNWATSLSGSPMNRSDIVDRLMGRVRKMRAATEE